MAKYQLIYFNVRGRAETSRLLFAMAGEKYEDKRVSQDEWKQMKSSTPFGGLPLLKVDGVTICQSKTIDRLLAKRFGLYGKTDIQQAQVDMIMDCMDDVMKPAGAIFQEQDEAKKAAMKKKMEEEHLPGHLEMLQKLLIGNKGGDGYFVGDNVTVADITAVHMLGMATAMGIDNKLDKYPKLKALKKRVEGLPKIAQWIANRPETPM